jgi:hypothetical protein
MNCLECLDLLQRRMDGETVSSAALSAHLACCPACRERFAAADLLREGLKPGPRVQPSPNFAAQMAARVLRDRAQRRRRLQRRLYVTATLAASVLVVFLISYWNTPRQQVPGPIVPVAKQDDSDRPTPERSQPKPEDTRQALLRYSERIVGTTREHARVLLTAANPLEQLPPGALPDLDPAAASLLHASKDVTEGVQTVTHSARRAFDYFAREIPMWEPAKGN